MTAVAATAATSNTSPATSIDFSTMPSTRADVFHDLRHRQAADGAWVDVAHMHNALTDNHFLDIIDVHGIDHGFSPDEGPAYAPRIRALSTEFRRQVAGSLIRAHLASSSSSPSVVAVPLESLAFGAPLARETTHQALQSSAAVIVNPVLANDSCRIIARLPLLLRPDVAHTLLKFPKVDHYVPVAIKRRVVQTVPDDPMVLRPACIARTLPEIHVWLSLLSDELSTSASQAAVIGLSSSRKVPVPFGVFNVETSSSIPFNPEVWRFGVINMNSAPDAKKLAEKALSWRTLVADEGAQWLSHGVNGAEGVDSQKRSLSRLHALASSSKDPRKRPNMKVPSMYDWPWHNAKRKIAEDIHELTLISGVSNSIAKDALSRDLPNDYKDDRISAENLGVSALFTDLSIKMCKADYAGPSVVPRTIAHNRFNWRMVKTFDARDICWYGHPAERLPFSEERSFFVDFELASIDSLYAIQADSKDIAEDRKGLSKVVDMLPANAAKTGDLRPTIFLIGCGRYVKGDWRYRAFVADDLGTESESDVIRKWLEYMHEELPMGIDTPYVFVWGPEQQLLKRAMKCMNEDAKAGLRNMSSLHVVNMLQVVTTGGLAIRGNYSNSLKRVGKALEEVGVLPNVDVPLPSDVRYGVDVMEVVLEAAESMRKEGVEKLSDVESMRKSEAYNEMDCLQLARITLYLRENH